MVLPCRIRPSNSIPQFKEEHRPSQYICLYAHIDIAPVHVLFPLTYDIFSEYIKLSRDDFDL